MRKKWRYLLFRGTFLTGGFMIILMVLADNYWLMEERFDRLYFFQLILESIFFMIIGTLIALYFWLHPKRTYKLSREK